jgi:hypothetical protein
MWNGFIGKQIDRCDRNIFLVNLGLILVPLIIGLNTVRYWNNFVSGPTSIDAQALSRIKNVDNLDHYFVTVKGRQVIDTGAEQIMQVTRNSIVTHEEVSAKYIALYIDNKLPLVRSEIAHTQNNSFTGVLTSIAEEIKINLASMSKKYPKLKDAFLPVLLKVR